MPSQAAFIWRKRGISLSHRHRKQATSVYAGESYIPIFLAQLMAWRRKPQFKKVS